MRIAQIAPLFESVPPRMYGGTERVVHYLTEELVRKGHEVTLFASGDSLSSARLVPGCEQALRLSGSVPEHILHHILLLERLFERKEDFDILHFHLDALPFPVLRRMPHANLTTLHGRLDLPALPGFFREYAEMPLVSISDSQRRPIPDAHWAATIHHGLPVDGSLRFEPAPGEYLAFLGRISPEKRVDRAIEIAKGVGMKLKIAAKVDPADAKYFEQKIRPLLGDPSVEFIGEIGEAQKGPFLAGARALLFPIDWPEPFGLVMIEALACGTPVVAFRRGSVPEILRHGVTGLLVDDVSEAIAEFPRIAGLSRMECRREFERRFSVSRMADDYLEVYESIAGTRKSGHPHRDQEIPRIRRADLYSGELTAG